ncbi:MAG TPA: PD-(D/E)XK nuclease family protein [Anaerolineaceae bacterium]|jgi:hypothetical protein|nr:PD-(D/E)XK nuclease family protein [Chloroflexota bacterium]HNR00966.1 PD-(D/E)XK nuclease family protein [Anaerolineaceae bacterium]HNS06517.1 PD-(D/E)XK nuclease family protein [Anaerolineaceae bacterium]HOE03341.1 PD-(D/E)XK nuclease family protein [Anaerolineaceae bacterium]
MKLPDHFSFSQYNLQDYVDCKFRFLLKHIHQLAWPAIESEPLLLQEARMELGQQFHRLIQQYFIGVEPGVLSNSIQTSELADWWQAFLSLKINEQPGTTQAEKMLSVSLNGHRLVAKFDLLLQRSSSSYTIYDWKTSTQAPSIRHLQGRLQSRVYPLVLWLSVTNSVTPPQNLPEIEMVYWFPAFPEVSLRFEYTHSNYEQDLDYLTHLIDEIQEMKEEDFTRTTDVKRCAYCQYRSLCDRGISAGALTPGSEVDSPDSDFYLDFDSL